jgi:hypothetical protein
MTLSPEAIGRLQNERDEARAVVARLIRASMRLRAGVRQEREGETIYKAESDAVDSLFSWGLDSLTR